MSTAATLDHIYTYDDLATLPDDHQRYEIIGGELIVSPAPILDHQTVVTDLIGMLWAFVRERQLGRVLVAPTDVKFSPPNVVEPDILFVRRDRLDILRRSFIDGAPDLVVEVLSQSSRRRDQIQKRALYAMAGVPEYRLIDPATRACTILTLADEQYAPAAADAAGRLASAVLPGFSLDPATLFADPSSAEDE